jgi:hypothetical protein
LIYLEGVDLPVSLGKGRWIIPHVVLTCGSLLRTNGIRLPHTVLAGPRAAERHVEDDGVILKDGPDVARALELGQRRWPRIGIWSSGCNVRRNGASGKVKDADRLAGPVDGVDASSGAVEAVAIRVCTARLDPASCIVVLSGRVNSTVG